MSTHQIFEQRCRAAQAEMQARGIDWLLVPHSTDLRYLIGFAHRQTERLALLMIPRQGRVRMVLPSFEIPVIEKHAAFIDLIGWQEIEDPVEKVRQAVVEVGDPKVVACGDELHAVFLLRLQAALGGADFHPGAEVLSGLRMVKDDQEQEALKTAGRYTDRALQSLLDQDFIGWTELAVRKFLHTRLLAEGCEAVGTGIVGRGPNSASPHHRTGEDLVQPGDALVIDFGGSYRGYRSDMTRTLFIGNPSQEFQDVYNIVQEAQSRAVEAVEPGVPAEAIDRVARDYITAKGYGAYFLHRTGHGIGLDGHEYPYLVAGDQTPLKPGMTFSVEPGIYLAGKFGVRIEDVVQVTHGKAEAYNRFPHDLLTVT